MIVVKTKDELISAIESGETDIRIDSKSLYAACKLAEKNVSLHHKTNTLSGFERI